MRRLEEASFLMVGHVHPFQHSVSKWLGKGPIKDPYFLISIPPSQPEEVAKGGKVRWERVWGGHWEIPGIFLPLCLGAELKGKDAELR